MPQQTQRRSDENGNYFENNKKAPVRQVETQENNLNRQQVVTMLKNRFKNDFDEWQSRKDQGVSKTRSLGSARSGIGQTPGIPQLH